MIKYLLIVFISLLSIPLSAQTPGPGNRPGNEKREDIESLKVAFLTRKLSLTPDEAKKFWPVYDQFANEMKAVKEARADKMKNAKDDIDQLSDKDLEKIVDGDIAFRQQELDVLKKYHSQFKQVLPMRKVAKLYRAEEDFKRELLERIREKRQDRKAAGPPSGGR